MSCRRAPGSRWAELDDLIRLWWLDDLSHAGPEQVAQDPTLLELPEPYVTASGASNSHFDEMYGWDTHFINLGLLAHGHADIVAQHLHNHLSMIDRYGKVLNGNRSYYLTRSQPPMLADGLAAYLSTGARDLDLRRAADLLAHEYLDYWEGPDHQTEIGLTRAFDAGDPRLRAELAAEAETGLDFCALFDGDARRCVPLVLNCALVRTAEVLARVYSDQGMPTDAEDWQHRRGARIAAIQAHCWDPDEAFFLEYDLHARSRLPYRSLAAYWTLWAGLATSAQAEALVSALPAFRARHGLTFTDRIHPSPHPEFDALQWQYPAGWPPMQIIVCAGLRRYGYHDLAAQIAADFVALQVEVFAETGHLWERYDVVEGHVDLPRERYDVVPMRGWSAAAAAVLGRQSQQTERQHTP